MVSGGAEDGEGGGGGGGAAAARGDDSLRLVGYLKANKLAAYVLAVMVLMHLSNQFDRYLFSVAKVPFLDYNSYDFALIVGPLFSSVNSVAGVLLSLVGDARPVRLLCTACTLWSASTGAVVLSRRFWQIALARIGQGVGDAACSPFASSILRDHFGPEVIGSAIGVYYTGLYAGYSLSLGTGTVLKDLLGWKWVYLLAALGGFAIAALAFATVPEPLPSQIQQQQQQQSQDPVARSTTGIVSAARGLVGNCACRCGAGGDTSGARAICQIVEDGSREFAGASPRNVEPERLASSRVNIEAVDDDHAESGDFVGSGQSGGRDRRSRVGVSQERDRYGERDGLVASRGEMEDGTLEPALGSAGTMPLRSRKQPGSTASTFPLFWTVEEAYVNRTSIDRTQVPQTTTSRHRQGGWWWRGLNFRAKLSDLSKAWLRSPSLLLVCVAGGVRDAGGYVFGYYLASYFSPLMDGNPLLVGDDGSGCGYTFDPDFQGEQICNAAFPWCIEGSCNRLTGSPWHDVGMSSAKLAWFISWVPLVAGSLGAMSGGFLSDRLAQRFGTAGRLWVAVVSNALAAPFGVGVLLAPYPWCFACLFGAELLGEMWIGVVVAVVMSLVPRRVRVTSVALYNFIITNISGLSTTLVPLVRAKYDASHVYRFFAEPLAGAAGAAAASKVADNAAASGSGFLSVSGGDYVRLISGVGGSLVGDDRYGSVGGEVHALVSRSGGRGGAGGSLEEFEVSATGSHGLQAAMFWMYPGMYLASSVLCLAAVLALRRDQRGAAATAAAATASETFARSDDACSTGSRRGDCSDSDSCLSLPFRAAGSEGRDSRESRTEGGDDDELRESGAADETSPGVPLLQGAGERSDHSRN